MLRIKNKSKFKKQLAGFLLLATLVIVFSFLFAHTAFAAVNQDTTDAKAEPTSLSLFVARVVGFIASIILSVLGFIFTQLVRILMWVVAYKSFVTAPPVNYGWTLVRDISNMFFVLILLVIAIATILRYESYNIKRLLPKVILMAILVNFSLTIAGLILDVAQVIMLTFVAAFAGTTGEGNLIALLHIDSIVKANSNASGGSFSLGRIVLTLILIIVMVLIATIVIGVVLAVLIFRIVMIWILLVLSPLAYILAAFPQGQKYASQWWQEYSKYVIIGPVLAFFLWLTFAIATAETDSQSNLLANELKDRPIPATSGTSITSGTGSVSSGLGKDANALDTGALNQVAAPDQMAGFIIAIAMLLGALVITQQMGVAGGSLAGAAFSKIKAGGNFMARLPGSLAKGAAKKAGGGMLDWATKNKQLGGALMKGATSNNLIWRAVGGRLLSEKAALGLGKRKRKLEEAAEEKMKYMPEQLRKYHGTRMTFTAKGGYEKEAAIKADPAAVLRDQVNGTPQDKEKWLKTVKNDIDFETLKKMKDPAKQRMAAAAAQIRDSAPVGSPLRTQAEEVFMHMQGDLSKKGNTEMAKIMGINRLTGRLRTTAQIQTAHDERFRGITGYQPSTLPGPTPGSTVNNPNYGKWESRQMPGTYFTADEQKAAAELERQAPEYQATRQKVQESEGRGQDFFESEEYDKNPGAYVNKHQYERMRQAEEMMLTRQEGVAGAVPLGPAEGKGVTIGNFAQGGKILAVDFNQVAQEAGLDGVYGKEFRGGAGARLEGNTAVQIGKGISQVLQSQISELDNADTDESKVEVLGKFGYAKEAFYKKGTQEIDPEKLSEIESQARADAALTIDRLSDESSIKASGFSVINKAREDQRKGHVIAKHELRGHERWEDVDPDGAARVALLNEYVTPQQIQELGKDVNFDPAEIVAKIEEGKAGESVQKIFREAREGLEKELGSKPIPLRVALDAASLQDKQSLLSDAQQELDKLKTTDTNIETNETQLHQAQKDLRQLEIDAQLPENETERAVLNKKIRSKEEEIRKIESELSKLNIQASPEVATHSRELQQMKEDHSRAISAEQKKIMPESDAITVEQQEARQEQRKKLEETKQEFARQESAKAQQLESARKNSRTNLKRKINKQQNVVSNIQESIAGHKYQAEDVAVAPEAVSKKTAQRFNEPYRRSQQMFDSVKFHEDKEQLNRSWGDLSPEQISAMRREIQSRHKLNPEQADSYLQTDKGKIEALSRIFARSLIEPHKKDNMHLSLTQMQQLSSVLKQKAAKKKVQIDIDQVGASDKTYSKVATRRRAYQQSVSERDRLQTEKKTRISQVHEHVGDLNRRIGEFNSQAAQASQRGDKKASSQAIAQAKALEAERMTWQNAIANIEKSYQKPLARAEKKVTEKQKALHSAESSLTSDTLASAAKGEAPRHVQEAVWATKEGSLRKEISSGVSDDVVSALSALLASHPDVKQGLKQSAESGRPFSSENYAQFKRSLGDLSTIIFKSGQAQTQQLGKLANVINRLNYILPPQKAKPLEIKAFLEQSGLRSDEVDKFLKQLAR